MTWTCAHCGQTCGDYDGGYARVTFDGGELVPVCHPNDPSRPDCYRRITVYREPLGSLIGVDPEPAGLEGVPRDELGLVDRVAAVLAVRHADHDPELPCRPALGHGLCYPVPASEPLIPWREALGKQER